MSLLAKALIQSIDHVKASLSAVPDSVMSGENRQCSLSVLAGPLVFARLLIRRKEMRTLS